MTHTRLISISAILLSSSVWTSTAQEPVQVQPTVLELYTSQSCGKCPDGNAAFATIAATTENVIALTFPIDYWDYLGWRDTFAKSEFSERQNGLNAALGRRGNYTPQVIMDAKTHCSARKPAKVGRKLNMIEAAKSALAPQVSVSANSVTLSGETLTSLDVWLVKYNQGEETFVPKGGPNEDREMIYFNRVTDIEKLPDWSGGITTTEISCPNACAVIVQAPEYGAIKAAAAFENATS